MAGLEVGAHVGEGRYSEVPLVASKLLGADRTKFEGPTTTRPQNGLSPEPSLIVLRLSLRPTLHLQLSMLLRSEIQVQ